MLHIALFGPPGAGKSVQSKLLVEKYQLSPIASGDILRKKVKEDPFWRDMAAPYMDKGAIMPAHLIIKIIEEKMEELYSKGKGFLFDGYPRSMEQVDALTRQLSRFGDKLTRCIALEVDHKEVEARLAIRLKVEGRKDDRYESMLHRLSLYEAYSPLILDHYRAKGLLSVVKGIGSLEEIHSAIVEAIEGVLSS